MRHRPGSSTAPPHEGSLRSRLGGAPAVLLGLALGLLVWGLILGAQARRHEAGLWTLRFQRIIACGLDYNGPPYTGQPTVWLTCGETGGWRLWPP